MKATARIQVTLDVPLPDLVWTDRRHAALEDVRHQAIEAGLKRLAEVLESAGGGAAGVRVLGEPHVTIVLVEDL
jgi:hypothetical protein